MLNSFRIGFYALLIALAAVYFSLDGASNFFYELIHWAIIALAISQITRAPSFNLGVSFSFFSLFFFGFIPLFEYKLGVTYHGSPPRESSYLAAGLLALVSSVFFSIGYSLRKPTRSGLMTLRPTTLSSIGQNIRFRVVTFLVLSLTALAIAEYHLFDPWALFFRGASEDIESTASGYSFVNFFARPLVFNLAMILILLRASDGLLRRPGVIVLVGLMVLTVSPLGIPRTLAGALYIPLLVLAFLPKLAGKYSLLCILTSAILIAAPVADIFRRVLQPGEVINLAANFNLDYFFAGHFDAFQNFVQVVDLGYSSEGWQIVGALLFWVPRAVWPGKPIGTSFDFAEFAGWRASNVSFPLHADLYVDFGVLGVVVGMFALGFIYKSVDNYLTKSQTAGGLNRHVFLIAQFELSILGIYLLRGAFLSSLAFTMGVASTLVLIAVGNRLLAGRRAAPGSSAAQFTDGKAH